ncbi:MAG: TIM barrel protein [Planctomycetes bacterium]|jgi:sugar phosphate isomerase/epimerase|nr:sugar phosphate isomerase/epimerase [Phycisphaerae bacterium]NBB94206.1 TIM barrel protein [Planctomycetota bacterium]
MTLQLGTVAPVGFDDFAEPAWLECMKQLGCTTAQAYRSRTGNDARHDGAVTTQQMRDCIAAAGLSCDSLHGFYGNDIDPASPDEAARRQAVHILAREGEVALDLGGPLVVVHCSGIYDETPARVNLDTRRDQLRTSIDELAHHGQDIGVTYAFENLPPYHAIGSDVAELRQMLDAADHPNVGMCFDVAHAHLAGDPVAAIDAAGDKICYMHVCDNHGQADEHLMPSLGSIPWDRVADGIAASGYGGVMMIEIFHSLDELRRMIDDGMAETLAAFLRRAKGE